MPKDVNKNKKLEKPETDAERAERVHKYFSNVPKKLAKMTALFEKKTKKDSPNFNNMCKYLNRLRNANGFLQIDQKVAEGKKSSQNFQYELQLAGYYTRKYLEHAEEKSALELGILGRRRLSAAKKLFKELQQLLITIQKEDEFLQNRRMEQEAQKAAENSGAESIPERNGRKMTLTDLNTKVNGKKSVVIEQKLVSDWVVVDTKQASKAAGPAKSA